MNLLYDSHEKQMFMKYLFLPLIFLIPAQLSHAKESAEARDLRSHLTCKSLTSVIKFYGKLKALPAEKRDTIDTRLNAFVKIKDDGALPLRLYYTDGNRVTDFTITPEGKIQDFAKIADLNPEGELCIEDPARVGTPNDVPGLNFEIDVATTFLDKDGLHALTDLQDGVADGKAHFKALYGGGARNFFIPKATHIMVTYTQEESQARIKAAKADKFLDGLTIESFDTFYIFALKDLETLGADSLHVSGGAYNLQPVPSPKKMKALGLIP